jgi:hypothetical protein
LQRAPPDAARPVHFSWEKIMHRTTLCAMALVLAVPAHAQESDLPKLRQEVKQLQQRIEDLEARPRQPARPGAGESAFNPGISVILQGTAARSSLDPEGYQITGFAPSGGEVGPAPRGFGLAESELVMSGNIDPYFRGYLVAALTPEDELEVEEAYFQTLALGRGFTLKGGRFLSGIGYQNELHQHAWDFQDAPLAYKAFLGGRLNDDGVQLRWVAPADLFIELGTELGRGRGFPATERNRNGANAWSLFGHVGGDLGASAAWRAGLSFLRASPEDRAFVDVDSLGEEIRQSFSGRSRLWIADFVVKWSAFKLQGEYFRRKESGELDFNGVASGDYASRQAGWYLQGVYQFMPRWRAGYRHDRLDHGTVTNALGLTQADAPLLLTDYNPTRNTLMVDFSPTEFSRIRLQYALDKSVQGATDHQLVLQYIHSLGAHGAHRF